MVFRGASIAAPMSAFRRPRSSNSPTFEVIPITPIPLTPTGVPADPRDRNHPHFPTADTEAQLPPRPYYKRVPCLSRQTLWVIVAVLLVLGTTVAGVFAGIRVRANRSPSVIPNFTSTEPETTYVTTTILSTMQIDLTSTSIATITQSLSMIGTDNFPAPTSTHTATKTVSFLAPVRPTPIQHCDVMGSWTTRAECSDECEQIHGSQGCAVGGKGWECVRCAPGS